MDPQEHRQVKSGYVVDFISPFFFLSFSIFGVKNTQHTGPGHGWSTAGPGGLLRSQDLGQTLNTLP
jgi:hypothetical protein